MHLPFADALRHLVGDAIHPFPVPGIVRADNGQLLQPVRIQFLAQISYPRSPRRVIHLAPGPHPTAVGLVHHIVHSDDRIIALGAQPGDEVGDQPRPSWIVRPADDVICPVPQAARRRPLAQHHINVPGLGVVQDVQQRPEPLPDLWLGLSPHVARRAWLSAVESQAIILRAEHHPEKGGLGIVQALKRGLPGCGSRRIGIGVPLDAQAEEGCRAHITEVHRHLGSRGTGT